MPVQFNVLCTTLLKLKFLNCCNNIQRFPINCVVPASHLVSISILPVPNAGTLRQRPLSRLERVFRCCSVCETMKDYKEGYLIVWTNYTSPCSSIVGLYFKGTCDIISVTIATYKIHKGVL